MFLVTILFTDKSISCEEPNSQHWTLRLSWTKSSVDKNMHQWIYWKKKVLYPEYFMASQPTPPTSPSKTNPSGPPVSKKHGKPSSSLAVSNSWCVLSVQPTFLTPILSCSELLFEGAQMSANQYSDSSISSTCKIHQNLEKVVYIWLFAAPSC